MRRGGRVFRESGSGLCRPNALRFLVAARGGYRGTTGSVTRQRYDLGDLALHQGAQLVIELEESRYLDLRQNGAEFWNVGDLNVKPCLRNLHHFVQFLVR